MVPVFQERCGHIFSLVETHIFQKQKNFCRMCYKTNFRNKLKPLPEGENRMTGLKAKTFKDIFVIALKNMGDSYYDGIAAELAFFFLLSMVPIMMVIGQLSGMFSVSLNFLVEFVVNYTPKEMAEIIKPYLKSSDGQNTSLIFLMLSLWFASRAFQAFIRISNYAYGFEVKGIRSFLGLFKGMVLTLLVIFMILFGLIVVVYGRVIGNMITLYIFKSFNAVIEIGQFWYSLRYVVALGVFFLILSYVYSTAPAKRIAYKRVVPGALFGTAGSITASLIFSFYVSHFASYDIIYGGLANIIVLMLWFYIIGYVLVIGIQINVAYEKIRRKC